MEIVIINEQQYVFASKLFKELGGRNDEYSAWTKMYITKTKIWKENEHYKFEGALHTGRKEFLLTIDTAFAITMLQHRKNNKHTLEKLTGIDIRVFKPTDRRTIWLGTMARIEDNNNHKAFVDHEDFLRIASMKWHSRKKENEFNRYAFTYVAETKKTKPMHRVVMNLTDYRIFPDHADRNGLNNQKSNLRIATQAENSKNKRANGYSKYIGVSFVRPTKKFRVKIDIGNRNIINVGTFQSEEEAAFMYDIYAMKYHKEFANLNFPNISPFAEAAPTRTAKETTNTTRNMASCHPCLHSTSIIPKKWYVRLHNG